MLRVFALVIALVALWLPAHADAIVDKADIPSGRLIIFVHGFAGDEATTFTNEESDAYWPDLLRSDGNVFERADIYTYSFDTGLGSASPGVDLLAKEMALRLEEELNVSSYSSVLFIAHSLGGVIVRKYLLDQFRLVDHGILSDGRVKGIYLLGTPMNGSGVASIGAKFFESKTLWQLSDATSDPDLYLSRLAADWVNEGAGELVSSWCGYETKEVGLFFIWDRIAVNWSSASALCNRGIVGVVGADHLQLVKPEDIKSFSHQIVRNWYKSIFNDRPLAPAEALIVSCEIDPYASTFSPLLAREFSKASVSVSASIRLPRDWSDQDVNYLWLEGPPKVIIVHYGCFADVSKDMTTETVEEADADFNQFLEALVPYDISVIMYSRAYYPELFEDRLTRANNEHFVDNGRICPVALKVRPKDRTNEAQRIVRIAENRLAGRACE